MFLSAGAAVSDNRLLIGGLPVTEMAQQYGTPLYIYDQEEIEQRCRQLQEVFKSSVVETAISYSSKAFLNHYTARLMDNCGLEIDALSLADLHLLREAGFPAEKIHLHGNAKTVELLQLALEMGIGSIIVDSFAELATLSDLAAERKQEVKISLRINPNIAARTHSYLKTATKDSKFGVSRIQEGWKDALKALRQDKYLHLRGLHFHIGSQVRNVSAFKAAAKTIAEYAENLSLYEGLSINELNFGGGFAILETPKSKKLNNEAVWRHMVDVAEKIVKEKAFPLKKISIEPGRYLMGPAGWAVYSVISEKRPSSKTHYLMLDGGMADNIRPALYQAEYTAINAGSVEGERRLRYSLAGNCCESGDIIIKEILLPPAKAGDIIAVPNSGAYQYVMASNYNGFSKPAIVFVKNGESVLTTRRQDYRELHREDLVQPLL